MTFKKPSFTSYIDKVHSLKFKKLQKEDFEIPIMLIIEKSYSNANSSISFQVKLRFVKVPKEVRGNMFPRGEQSKMMGKQDA